MGPSWWSFIPQPAGYKFRSIWFGENVPKHGTFWCNLLRMLPRPPVITKQLKVTKACTTRRCHAFARNNIVVVGPLPEEIIYVDAQERQRHNYVCQDKTNLCTSCADEYQVSFGVYTYVCLWWSWAKGCRFQYICSIAHIPTCQGVQNCVLHRVMRVWVQASFLSHHQPCTIAIPASSQELVHLMHPTLNGSSHDDNINSRHVYQD